MGRLQVAIDRGGTFTDVVARTSDGKIVTMKLLSEDPEKYKDAPTEAIRRLLKQVLFFNIKECHCIFFVFYLGIFST
jgi:N-methylhydantoinase A/oxoprolinase/acetone carboxylase beta subunit